MKEKDRVSPEMKIAAKVGTTFVNPNIEHGERPFQWHVQQVLTQKEQNDRFERELTELLNKYGKDTECNSPDYILARTLVDALNLAKTFNNLNQLHKTQCKKES